MSELRKIDEKSWPKVHTFLLKHISSSMFLISNFEDHGANIGEHINSGNYYYRWEGDRVTGVFSYTLRGNILFQDGGIPFNSHEVIARIKVDIPSPLLRGSVGTEPSAKNFFEDMAALNIIGPHFASSEVLYSLDLNGKSFTKIEGTLSKEDFSQWHSMMLAFSNEVGLGDPLTQEQYQINFEKQLERKSILGIKKNGELISVANLNARYKNLGQVGGVYTLPDYRKKGLAKEVMSRFMNHAVAVLGIDTMILFTGQENAAARALYEGLGYKEIGRFGLYLGK